MQTFLIMDYIYNIPINQQNLPIMALPDFPNGFESWQKTHFEVVEVLCYIRDLEERKQPKSFSELVDNSATEDMYKLAIDLTNKYEDQTKGKTRQRSLFDEIEEFVWRELKGGS